ncbi:unnamed protein product [Nezara viridula]|nr:unnamed protein product [Nezara viridula]
MVDISILGKYPAKGPRMGMLFRHTLQIFISSKKKGTEKVKLSFMVFKTYARVKQKLIEHNR